MTQFAPEQRREVMTDAAADHRQEAMIGAIHRPDDPVAAAAAESCTVIIPVFNEVDTIERIVDGVIRELDAAGQPGEILVLNDGSTDWSPELEQRLRSRRQVRVKSSYPNQGKGAVLSRTFRELATPLAAVIDADGEYAPEDIPELLKPLRSGAADWVHGSRYGFGRPRPRQYAATYLVNRLLSLWFGLLSGVRFKDLLNGLYGFRVGLVRHLELRERRFSYTPELMWSIVRDRRARIRQIPVRYRFRRYADGKKIRWWETATIFLATLRYRFSRLPRWGDES